MGRKKFLKLSEPSREMARKMLSEVDFQVRLIGYKIHPKLGPVEVALYSFEELVGLMVEPRRFISLEKVEQWVREVMGDLELAGRIREISAMELAEQEKLNRLAKLLGMRMLQCKEKCKV